MASLLVTSALLVVTRSSRSDRTLLRANLRPRQGQIERAPVVPLLKALSRDLGGRRQGPGSSVPDGPRGHCTLRQTRNESKTFLVTSASLLVTTWSRPRRGGQVAR